MPEASSRPDAKAFAGEEAVGQEFEHGGKGRPETTAGRVGR